MLRNVTLKGFLKYAAQSKIAVVHLVRLNHLERFISLAPSTRTRPPAPLAPRRRRRPCAARRRPGVDAADRRRGDHDGDAEDEVRVDDAALPRGRSFENKANFVAADGTLGPQLPRAPRPGAAPRRRRRASPETTRRRRKDLQVPSDPGGAARGNRPLFHGFGRPQRTMSTPGEYQWKETAEKVIVRINLRGCSAKSVDVYAADVYAKVSYPPRLVELDLINEVDEDGAVAKIKDGHLTLSLPKKQPGETWGASSSTASSSKSELLERRRRPRRAVAREQEIGERAKDRKQEDDRTALRKQMKLDETERCTVEEKKATEKSRGGGHVRGL
ncbi:hypothetical protein JL720_13857 [Aureococcus anophagefferens]|nr:hypothetical protein JL720_13857 [Aureococcus anophagefferens]